MGQLDSARARRSRPLIGSSRCAFLKIVREDWPAIRAEHGTIEPAERRDLLIEAEAKRLAAATAPVIAAGSTGSMPATAELLATIAKLPHGAVVLPGLDTDLDEASWALIAGNADDKNTTARPPPAIRNSPCTVCSAHRHRAQRRDGAGRAARHGRERLVSEALRPAATTELWQQRRDARTSTPPTDAALASRRMIEAANAEEEALAIAVALREALETPGKTAALVTPDRALARRVIAALERWQRRGRRFRRRRADRYAGRRLRAPCRRCRARRLGAGDAAGAAEASAVAARAPTGAHRAAIAALERALLRGPRPRAGTRPGACARGVSAPSATALHRSDPRLADRATEDSTPPRADRQLAAALAPLESLKGGADPFADARRMPPHVVAALALTDGDALPSPAPTAPRSTDALRRLIASPTAAGLALARGEYADLFDAAMADRVVRRPESRDVRVRIFGPLEARLHQVDRVVLGGLNEGTWPPETRNDPWLSRPMRRDSASICRSGASAFPRTTSRKCLGAPEVMLTRAAKLAGAPTVASRFVQRLAAVAGERAGRTCWRAASTISSWRARSTSRPNEAGAAAGAEAAARRAAAAAFGHRHRALAARSLHHLRQTHSAPAPLDAVDTPPGARDRGTVIHGAIGDFTETFRAAPPADPLRNCSRSARSISRARRFSGSARLLVAALSAHRALVRRLGSASGAASVARCMPRSAARDIPARRAHVHAAARRRPHRTARDGCYAILDYKTGQRAPKSRCARASRRNSRWKPRSCAQAASRSLPPAARSRESPMCTLKGGEPAGKPKASTSRTAPPTATPTARWRSSRSWRRSSRTKRRPISRWCIRCGRRTTATTTTSRASRNGRSRRQRRGGGE